MTPPVASRARRLATALLLTATALLTTPTAAHAGPSEPELVTLANRARAAAGVAPLTARDDLTQVARDWSQRMAREGRLRHNPAVGSQVCCWQAWAENVGYSSRGAGDVQRMFLDSAGHRANLLAAGSTEVGIGTATDPSGRIWVTEVFRRPTAQAAPRGPQPVGLIRDRWLALGGARSVVGSALTGELATPDRLGRYTVFQRGSVYWTPWTGAHEVYGAIRDRWAAERWEAGRLGYPVRGEHDVRGGRATDFEHGRIVWSRATGTTRVELR